MKEIPILFNAEMVQAILDGRKTQTRRPFKVQPEYIGTIDGLETWNWNQWTWQYGKLKKLRIEAVSPFGNVGDHLWVRENFRYGTRDNGQSVIVYVADGEVRELFASEGGEGDLCKTGRIINERVGMDPCRPSIHMPRWASRITLEVTDIRVQRVQEISEEDAMAEGIDLKGYRSNTFGISGREHRIEFSTLWQSIYNTWDANPWVWVATFEVVK